MRMHPVSAFLEVARRREFSLRIPVLLILLGLLPLSRALASAQGDQRTAREPSESLPLVIEGTICSESGAPVASAIVRSDMGGRTVSDAQGRFRLELELPTDVLEVEVTAVQTSGSLTGTAHRRVAVPPGGTLVIGALPMSRAPSCSPTWLSTFGERQELHNEPYALASFDAGDGPRLYAAGTDITNHIVSRWDGTSWSAAGTITGGPVYVRVHDDGSGPALYAGGRFTMADGQPASGLAKWDGTGWTGLNVFALGSSDYIRSMEVFDDGSGPAQTSPPC